LWLSYRPDRSLPRRLGSPANRPAPGFFFGRGGTPAPDRYEEAHKARTIASVYNTLGQLTSYTDAEGSTTKYAYDIDGRVEEVSEPKGKQIYAYDATTGFLTKLQDSAAGMFTATYGVAGELLTVGYPNAMTAKHTYNTIGQATNLEYEKTAHCAKTCPEVWFSDVDAYGPKGELAHQAGTLATENYSYNELGQLTQTQETPVGGKGCVTRLYGYNEASGERESLTTREPNEKGECTTEGGVVEGHFYDAVGRLIDPGVTYDALGNMTKTPALDAGGMAITSSFYVDNQVATQEQNEKSIAYTYDPAGRTMIAKTTTKSGSTTAISHYAGPGNSLTWTCEETGECKEEKESKWTRNIPGIDGALDAIQANGGTPVLQLHDLQGNIVGTVADNESETKLEHTYISTEFGVPSGKEAPPKYAWLGASGTESELGTGVITQAGATYVPQIARNLQTEQTIPPGAAPNGVMDTEAYCPPELGWANESGDIAAENTVAEQRSLEEHEAILNAVDPEKWVVMEQDELRALANELEDDVRIVEEETWMLEGLPGDSGIVVQIGAQAAIGLYRSGAVLVAGGLRRLARVVEKEWNTSAWPRDYLINYHYSLIPAVGSLVRFINTGGANIKLINPYSVDDFYCQNEGVFGRGINPNAYKTYFKCDVSGKWQVWGVQGIR
jgi:YD repeat-containing protein